MIRLDVEPIFSQLNFGLGTTINGGPAPRHHPSAVPARWSSCREGQTLAIAGLLQTSTNARTLRVPGLGDLPIVGPWFSSNRIETVETELVVLVTPELVAPMEAKEVPPPREIGSWSRTTTSSTSWAGSRGRPGMSSARPSESSIRWT